MNPNIHRLLANLRNVEPCGDGWTSYCPIHEAGPGTHHNSLSVKVGDNGGIVVHCHGGCDYKDVIYATGLTLRDCAPPKKDEPKSKIVATYDYFDVVDGQPILRFQVCRLEPDKSGKPGTKTFQQRQPDGKGGWSWKTKGIEKVLYRLPELLASTGPVFVVEGEKQVDYLRSIGLNATCNPGGAGKWLKTYVRYLTDCDVVIVPDADPPNPQTGLIPGMDHAKTVADSALPVAKSVHVVELPGCEPKWGLDDWLQKGGHTLQELAKILETAEPWGPTSQITTKVEKEPADPNADPLEHDRKILADIGITYVAQYTTGDVEVFSTTTQKFSTIDPAKLKYEDLILATGASARLKVRRGADDDGQYSMNEVRAAIAAIAAVTPAIEEKHGLGCWLNNGSIVIVNAKELGILNGKPGLQISREPMCLGKAYDIGAPTKWVDLARLRDELASVGQQPGKLYHDAIWECIEFLGQWQFTSGNETFPSVLTGMIMATWLQTMWSWRPQIFLIGQSYAGKSTLLKQVGKIMGPLAMVSSDSSAAGLRQEIGTSATIMLCDELEKSSHRKDIFDMIKASGRGDNTLRGTPGHRGKRFKLQHSFWCASIESGLKSEADQSRFITAEIRKTSRHPQIPHVDHLTELGRKLFAAAIAAFPAAVELSTALLEHKVEGIHGRVCESYSIPCAMLATALGFDQAAAIGLFHQALGGISESETVEDDAETLLQEILLTTVLVRAGEKHQIHSMIGRRLHNIDFPPALASVGIMVSEDRIYLNRNLLERYVVSQEWKGKRLDQILMRLPGAERNQHRFGESVLRCVSIPRRLVGEIEIAVSGQSVVTNPFAEQF